MKGLTHYLKDLEARLTEEDKEVLKECMSFMLQVSAIFAFCFALIFAIIIYVL